MVKNLPVSAGGVGQEDSLEKENGSLHQCSCLENPMDREPGRLQSMGSQRVTHDLSTEQQQRV